MSQLTNELLVD